MDAKEVVVVAVCGMNERRRVSPRLHPDSNNNNNNIPIPMEKRRRRRLDGEDASKESVLQRRLSPRLNPNNKHKLDHHISPCMLAKPQDDNVDDSAARSKVNDTLRIYNSYYFQLLQEEDQRRNQHSNKPQTPPSQEEHQRRTSFRPDLKALTKMRNNNKCLNSELIIGHVPGIHVGHRFYSRAEMVAVGLHNHWLHGIGFVGKSASEKTKFKHYTLPFAVSVVMSGQYEDDLDNSDDIIYTGQGGHDLVATKQQTQDQSLVRGNLALKNSMDQSVPIRVIRGHDNPGSYTGRVYSYGGLYKVVETLASRGCRGHLIYSFRLRRLEGQPKLTTVQVGFVRGGLPRTPQELPGLICRDITNGQENFSIPVTNIYDEPPVGPEGFTYIKSMEVAESVKLPPYATGCKCKGNCRNPSTCGCAKLNGSDFPYVSDRGGRLCEAKDIVFECGPNCGCGPECLNRTSQRGMKYRFEVYRTPNKGWGVRSWDFIPQGAPVCEYIGVLRRSDELDGDFGTEFHFYIDCMHTINEIGGRERRLGKLPVAATKVLPKIDKKTLHDTPEFAIDASLRGNVTRFINHSCEPNLFVQCVLSSYHDPRFARLLLFAAEDIPARQELTYDYAYALDSVRGSDGKIKKLPCFCGTAECRKRLY